MLFIFPIYSDLFIITTPLPLSGFKKTIFLLEDKYLKVANYFDVRLLCNLVLFILFSDENVICFKVDMNSLTLSFDLLYSLDLDNI